MTKVWANDVQVFSLNSDQIEFVRAWLKDPTVILFFWHLLKKGYEKAIAEMEENIMSEVRSYIDEKFEAHEANAFARISALESCVKELKKEKV